MKASADTESANI